jgi:Zn-finger nucleic acid-binding protein
MKCPNDQEMLQMSERHGIEIDYCPSCRGVWLDRGELDKIIDKANSSQSVVVSPSAQAGVYESDKAERQPAREGHNYRDDDMPYTKKRRKESFLGDLFDFGE